MNLKNNKNQKSITSFFAAPMSKTLNADKVTNTICTPNKPIATVKPVLSAGNMKDLSKSRIPLMPISPSNVIDLTSSEGLSPVPVVKSSTTSHG